VKGGVRLSWNDLATQFGTSPAGVPAVGAEDYKVEVTNSSDPQFEDPTVTATVDASCDATANTCYAPPATVGGHTDQTVVEPTSSGDFIWRVIPIDLTGNELPAATDSTPFSADLTAPTLTISTKNGVAVSSPLTIVASHAVTGVSSSTVHVVPAGKSESAAVAGTLHQEAADTWTFTPKGSLATGGTYNLVVDPGVSDSSGNSAVVTGNGVRTTLNAKDTSKGWSFGSGWTKHAASGALSGSYRSARAGKKAHIVVTGSEAKLFACKSPSMGKLTITVGGHSQTVSEHQSFTRCGVEVWHHALSSSAQTVTIKVAKTGGNVDELSVT
jgi:hypothetical protein